jgi:hypothetical protein
MNKYYDIFTYTSENLAFSLCNSFVNSDDIKKKVQYHFFIEYLESQNAKTIIIEYNYFSKIYIDSFLPLYQKGFLEFSKQCKRVHFFSIEILEDEFKELIYNEGNYHNSSSDKYIGNIVIRPVPDSIFGESLLVPPPMSEGIRLNSLMNYSINLFGISFNLNSLPFLEQDKYITTCANVALWIALNRTSHLFHHKLPNISEINSLAGQSHSVPGRRYGTGFEVFQICNVIESLGLECEVRTEITVSSLKAIVASYNSLGIPILFGYSYNNEYTHLVTLIGYDIGKPGSKIKNPQDINLFSERITSLYCFDDQSGPYSKITIDSKNKVKNWNGDKIEPHVLIVPIAESIRVKYEDILIVIHPLANILDAILHFKNKPYWDLELLKSQRLKSKIRFNSVLSIEEKNKIIFSSLPEFIWAGKLIVSDTLIVELFFDATSFQVNYSAFCIIFYDLEFKSILKQFFNKQDNYIKGYFKELSSEYYYNLILESLK